MFASSVKKCLHLDWNASCIHARIDLFDFSPCHIKLYTHDIMSECFIKYTMFKVRNVTCTVQVNYQSE